MNDEQITALAREYAEWMIKDAQCEELPNCLKKTILASNTEYAEEVFRWLLRRFSLVEKSKVQELYNSYCAERDKEEPGSNRSSLGGRIAMLQELFGSKCLPDEVAVAENATTTEPKSAEPKFKMGDKVKNIANPHDDGIYRIDDIKETSPNVNHSDINIDELVATGCVPDPAKHFDTILKDSFRNERRLNIVTQMVKAIMQCPGIVERIASAEVDSLLDDILHDALYLTDRLMSECEKGGMK